MIGIGCTISVLDDQSFSFVESSSSRSIAVLPCAHYFTTSPTICKLVDWAMIASSKAIILFSPLASASFHFDEVDSTTKTIVALPRRVQGDECQELQDLCHKKGIMGILFSVRHACAFIAPDLR